MRSHISRVCDKRMLRMLYGGYTDLISFTRNRNTFFFGERQDAPQAAAQKRAGTTITKFLGPNKNAGPIHMRYVDFLQFITQNLFTRDWTPNASTGVKNRKVISIVAFLNNINTISFRLRHMWSVDFIQ